MPLFFFLAIHLPQGSVFAHGVVISTAQENGLPVSTFHYADGIALSYGEVKIWAPGDAEVEFQNGRTDKNGRFAFIPDQSGTWRVEVTDGMGHAATAKHEVQVAIEPVKNDLPQENNQPLLAILGVSLLLNLALLIEKWRR